VEKIEEFLRDQRLRWFGHVERMEEERVPVQAMKTAVDSSKKGRPKKKWSEVLERDIKERGLQKSDAYNRDVWRLCCKNRLTPACKDDQPDSRGRRRKSLLLLLEQNDDDDHGNESISLRENLVLICKTR